MKARRAFYQVTPGPRRLIAVICLVWLHAGGAGAEGCAEVWDSRQWQRVAVAQTHDELMAGLSGRGPGGMLFAYPDSDIRWFWMQGMTFDLDIYWLDAGGWVVGGDRMAVCEEGEPCGSIASPAPVRYVLELPADTSPIWVGQHLEWRDCRE